MIARSRYAALRESPVPVLLVLVALVGFIEYLHWTVIRSENLPRVVEVPSVPPLPDEGDEGGDDVALWGPPATESSSDGASGPIDAEARALAAAGRPADALARLEASLAKEGKRDATRLHQRGVLLLGLRRDREALADLTEAHRLRAGSATLLYNLGLARSRTGDRAGAEAAYRATVAANPHFDEAWNNLGLLLERRGDRAGAVDALRRAVDLAGVSDRPRAMTNLARVLARDGRRDEATSLLVEAIRLAPASVAARLALGEVERERSDGTARARGHFEAAIRLAPGNPAAYF